MPTRLDALLDKGVLHPLGIERSQQRERPGHDERVLVSVILPHHHYA